MSDDTDKLSVEQAQKNWQDLTPEEMANALAAVETLQRVAEILPTLTDDQKETLKIRQEADKQKILKAGRRQAEAEESVEIFHESRATANSGPVDLAALLINPPAGYEPRVWDPVSKQVLMRKGQIGSLAGPDKGGKTRIAVSLMYALLDPTGKTPFLRYYTVEPLRSDQLVVHIALEEDDADMFAAWGPYLKNNPSFADRVISISYSGVNVNMTAAEIRAEIASDIFKEVFKREQRTGKSYDIGAVVIDPLFAMAQGDYNKDPRLATDVFNQVLKSWCKDQLGAEIVLVLAHTSREGGRMGSEGSIYGSIGWASKMHFLWYVLKDQKQDDYRLFGANRGRADTYAFPQRLYMLTEEAGDPEELWGQIEVRPEEGEEAAKERASGKTENREAKPRKTAVLTVKVIGLLAEAGERGESMTQAQILHAISTEAAVLTSRGEDVPFSASQSSISKVIVGLEADRRIRIERDTVDTKIKNIFWNSPDGSGAASAAASLMPPTPAEREVLERRMKVGEHTIVAGTGEIIGTDGDPSATVGGVPE